MSGQPIYVLAGSYRDYENWCRDHRLHPKHADKVRPILELRHVQGRMFEPDQVQWAERAHENPDFRELHRYIEDRTMRTLAERNARQADRLKRRPEPCDHNAECCFVHETHATPHVGCILR